MKGHESEAGKVRVLVQSFQEREAQQVVKITMRKSLDAAVYHQQSRERGADMISFFLSGKAANLELHRVSRDKKIKEGLGHNRVPPSNTNQEAR